MGTSAGVHLLSLMALAGDAPVFQSPYTEETWHGYSAKLDVAIVTCGIYDMISQWEHDQLMRPLDHITERYMGGTPMSIREKFYQASPLYHASSQNAAGTKWLIAWGTADNVVDYKIQALPFLTALTRAGALVRSVELVGAEHFWTMEPLDSDVHCRIFTGRLPQFFTNCGWGL
ncbi:MAG: prolyl oligopeptidase family serine peptidase [Nitrososphaerales archaeon]